MDIRELLRTDLMIMDLKAQTKAEVIDEMVRNLFEKGVIKDEEAYKKDIIKKKVRPEWATALPFRMRTTKPSTNRP